MNTDITIDPDAVLPDAYSAEHARCLARLKFDPIPEEPKGWPAYQIKRSAGTSEFRDGSPQLLNDLKFRDASVIASGYFYTAIATVPYWGDEGVSTSTVIIFDNLSFLTQVDWDRWHELLDKAETGKLLPDEAIEYEQMEEVVQTLDEREARIASQGLDQLNKRHNRVLASIRRLTEAVIAATRSS